MKKTFWFLVLLLLAFDSYAQKNDYVWLQGYGKGFNPVNGLLFGTTVFDFNTVPRQVYYDSLKMNFDFSNTSFCDNDGQLLLYTNAIYVANGLDEKIENSDSMTLPLITFNFDPAMYEFGYRVAEGVYIVPAPAQTDKYYVLHMAFDDVGNNDRQGTKLAVTFIDMNLNGGHGKAVYKNEVVLNGVLSPGFALTRHANGRDWWALVQKRNSNCYYRVLIDDSGVHALPGLTCAGYTIPNDWVGPLSFTPDGSKFIYESAYGGLNIYDFDRCNGLISNPVHLTLSWVVNLGWNAFGLSASPDSRFLYVSVSNYLYQFDLTAPDILASIDTVAIVDSTYPIGSKAYSTSQLAPDGKIYISTEGGGDTVCHVIERPNEKGDSCLVAPHSLHMPSACVGIPNFPNYRLGALPGSPCDTLTGLNEVARAEKEKILKLYPNPTTDFVTIDYGFTDWNKGGVSLEIVDALGQIVYNRELPMYSGLQKIDVHTFVGGFYTTYIKRNGQVVATGKFVRE